MLGKMTRTGILVTMATILTVVPLDAQVGRGARGASGPNMGKSLGLVLENQEELGLDQSQVSRLQELKGTLDQDVTPVLEEMQALRDMIRAGEVEQDDGIRQMEALRGQLITNAAPIQGRIPEILTLEQHRKLQSMVRQGRPGAGRGGAVRGRGAQRLHGPGAGLRGSPPGVRGRAGARSGFRQPGRVAQPGLRRGFGGTPAATPPQSIRGSGGGRGGQFLPGGGGEEGLPTRIF
jgi:hypothetical protein